jgi:hypothetical protein
MKRCSERGIQRHQTISVTLLVAIRIERTKKFGTVSDVSWTLNGSCRYRISHQSELIYVHRMSSPAH